MGIIVIVAYKPKVGREDALDALMKDHLSTLRRENLVTDRDSIIMKAEDGTVVEVFEWRSKEAIESAHANEAVQAIWKAFGEVCEYVPIASVPEASSVFSEFTPMN